LGDSISLDRRSLSKVRAAKKLGALAARPLTRVNDVRSLPGDNEHAGQWEKEMHPYPHTYVVDASASPTGDVAVSSTRLPALTVAPPQEFDGPGDRWSPETLLCAAVANCFILTFRAHARASKLEWSTLQCRTEAILDRVDGVPQFTRFVTHATLTIPAGADPAKAHPLLQKAEERCLVTNSLKGERHLEATVETVV
jgi:organic hydroperoxide reductase OsmC/OhrA